MCSDVNLQVQIGHFTLDNAANNDVAMEELQVLLANRQITDFDPLNNRVRCYAHIINICSSHVIASFTSTSKSYLSQLNVPLDPESPTCGNLDSDDESSDSGDGDQDFKLKLPGCYSRRGKSMLSTWVEGLERDPLRRARRVIRLLRSSDEHRTGLKKLIQDGNERGWFTVKDSNGNRDTVTVPELQLLRDVKTRWDSVYMMLLRLRELRPVSWSWCL